MHWDADSADGADSVDGAGVLVVAERVERVGGMEGYLIEWREPGAPGSVITLLIVPNPDGRPQPPGLRMPCRSDAPTAVAARSRPTLFGRAAEQCLVRASDPIPAVGRSLWAMERFITLPEYWVVARATGPWDALDYLQTNAEVSMAIVVFDSARATGLDFGPD